MRYDSTLRKDVADDGTPPEVEDALLLPRGAERPLDSGGRPDKGVIESQPSDPLDDLLKGLDGKTSEQKKDDQPILPQGAEPVGQGQPEQPAGKNPPPDEGKPAEEKRFEPAEEKPDIRKGRGRNGRPTDRVIGEQCPNCTTLTIEEIDQIFTKATRNKKDILISSFLEVNQRFGLDSCQQKAHFFAQVLQEVGRAIDINQGESLNYRVDALPMHFSRFSVTNTLGGAPNELARRYDRVERKIGGKTVIVQPANQRMIANIVYAGRNGNGNIESGDGWRFRGKGIIQVTGKDKYTLINNIIVKYYPSFNIVIDADNINNLREGAIASMAYWLGSGCKK